MNRFIENGVLTPDPFLSSFNLQERYQERFLGPIQQSTILVVDPDVGAVMKASGRNM